VEGSSFLPVHLCSVNNLFASLCGGVVLILRSTKSALSSHKIKPTGNQPTNQKANHPANQKGNHTAKKVTAFPVVSRDVTYQPLPGRELLNYSRPGGVW
jgi:hypothetical protein